VPTCVRCTTTKATGELRRRRGHPDEFVCRDTTPCDRRVAAAKATEQARHLSPRKRRRIELALEQLDKLKAELPSDVWLAAPLFDVYTAREGLADYLKETN
jgi:hypothetical protein